MIGHARRGFPGTRAARRAIAAVLLLGVALLLVTSASRGVEVTRTDAGPDASLPVMVYVPDGDVGASVPGVVVAHGFAGSAMLMHTWSLALAHAGFVVVAPDLPGHGRNLATLDGGPEGLAAAVELAVGHLVGVPGVDADRIALLGHSMGSGAVLDVGVARSELVAAVVAVSPTDADVTSRAPRDLLLLAGANEGRFVANAESLLERAGGERGTPGEGEARALRIVPLVEHVTILFSGTAHDASIEWLAAALAHDLSASAPLGPLAGWGLLVFVLVLLWQALVAQGATAAAPPAGRAAAWLAFPVGGVAATASLVIVARSIELSEFTGLLVAGEVGLWFLMAGTVWLRFGIRPAAPEARDLGWALLATAVLVGIGGTSTLAWAPWWLGGTRATAAILLALLLLPYAIAAASLLHGRRGGSAVLVWLFLSVAVVTTLGAAAIVVPGLGFLVLVLPLVPVVLALTVAVSVGVDRPWATGPATAVFLGWLFAMLFPLA